MRMHTPSLTLWVCVILAGDFEHRCVGSVGPLIVVIAVKDVFVQLQSKVIHGIH